MKSATFKAVTRAFLVVALAGCYVYVPAPANSLPGAGEEVRAVLTDAGTAAMAPLLGDGVGFVDGRVQALSDTALTLAVSETTTRAGMSAGWTGEKVVIRRELLSGLRQKTLSRSRSFGLGAAALAAAVASYVAFRAGGSTTGGGGSGGGGGHR